MRRLAPVALIALCLAPLQPERAACAQDRALRAGAAVVDVSPPKLPAIVNGGFLEASANQVRDPLAARALVLDDGTTRLAIVVVDSCMMPRSLIDQAKALARERTGIAVERMLVSATHTHTAPSTMGALGSRPDPDYVAFLPARIVEAIAQAAANLAPARVGWSVVDDFEHTHCRRWIRKPDRLLKDPFGNLSARANMHPGHESPDVIGPSGPVDPGLSVVAFQSLDGQPIAALANYSMHYFGAQAVSADYYGRFCAALARRIGAKTDGDRPFVAIMSQGTSGDQQWMDYAHARPAITIDAFADAVAARAHEAYQAITYQERVPLGMAETRLTLRRRVPDPERLAWARPIVAAMADRVAKDQREVYAREALFLHEEPERELVLQAVRIGTLGITAIPDEVYALSGLKLKARSPFPTTFNIELANGAEGYIPPPEQHELGGYTTWPARTAGLEVQAEPKIVESVLRLLEQVSGQPRRADAPTHGPYAEAVLASKPRAYWRLEDMDGRQARDATGHGLDAQLHPGFAFFLEGPESPGFSGPRRINRAVHLAGGHITARVPDLPASYTVEFWFWHGLPAEARGGIAELAQRGHDEAGPGKTGSFDRLSTRADGAAYRLVFDAGAPGSKPLEGTTTFPPRTWHHVVLVRDGPHVTIHLDGQRDIEGPALALPSETPNALSFGGRAESASTTTTSLEGKLDEIAVYDRAMTGEEIVRHWRAFAP